MTDSEDLRARVTMAVASICRPHPACEPHPDETAIINAVMEIFEPSAPTPPGLELRRVMQAMGLSQVKFAASVGVSTKHLNQVCSGAAAITPILTCLGCSATMPGPNGTPNDISPSEHCGQCPPWRCETCGEMSSAAFLCSCWTRLDGMALADIKALFAGDGTFNVGADGCVTVAEQVEGGETGC